MHRCFTLLSQANQRNNGMYIHQQLVKTRVGAYTTVISCLADFNIKLTAYYDALIAKEVKCEPSALPET